MELRPRVHLGVAELGYYRARYYDPKVGRFIAEDPSFFDSGVNLYAYVKNNPVRSSDPLGLKPNLTDFLLNPVRCLEGMATAGKLAKMVLEGAFPSGRDKEAHCLAFCFATKGCGPFWGGFAFTVGVGFSKEAFDTVCFYSIRPELGQHFNIKGPCYGPWDEKDLDADFWGTGACPAGQSCDDRCKAIPQDY